ncbi:MAG: HAD-IA family hydrolase [candidate division Zixibacteria bacterium]|jgi:HAD superfamily hydrolase (TIGR01509 family)|nr:HAD-IA family hydrolase [candidate division Zixibacteria bacterium]
MIRAVLYDLGDIFFEAHHWRQWMYHRLTELGHVTGSFANFYWSYERALQPVYEGSDTYDSAFRSFVYSTGMKDPETFIEESYQEKRRFEAIRELYPGVRETLHRLKRDGIANVVVSDNELTGERVRAEILSRFDLNPLIESVVTSHDTGCRKPDPAIYRIALETVGCHVTEAVFVGHDADEIEGANRLGICTIEFNNYLGTRTGADWRVNSFPQIREIVQSGATLESIHG